MRGRPVDHPPFAAGRGRESDPDDPVDPPRGRLWPTFHYRMAGDGVEDGTGTMKGANALSAARRIVTRRLGEQVGTGPVYLRLRTAGDEEVLVRVTRTPDQAPAKLRIEIVPAESYHFPPPPQR